MYRNFESKILIKDLDYARSTGFLLTEKRGDKYYVAIPVKFEFKEICIGEEAQSTFILPEEIVQCLAEALDKKGIKTENDFKIQGLLEAKEKHLDDMRTLVFKKKGV